MALAFHPDAFAIAMCERTLHVLPLGDLVEHTVTRHCWCGPTLEASDGTLLVTHHSADGRELREQAERARKMES